MNRLKNCSGKKYVILLSNYSMGIKKKEALGPNPLSVKKSSKSKKIKKDKNKPRRKRKGVRSKKICSPKIASTEVLA